MAHYNLDSLDKKILKLIAKDARIPFLEVARLCNVSGAAIHQRIQKLTNLGVLKGSQFNRPRDAWLRDVRLHRALSAEPCYVRRCG